jgi:transposase
MYGRKEEAMSLRSPAGDLVPDETARVARAAFPKGNLYMEMQAELGMIYTNHQFASLFSATGQPAEDPVRLALILVMQTSEGLPDRQTAAVVRGRIDWKYALALELTDPGFADSVLSEFRKRLVTGQLEVLLLDTLLQHLQERGLLQARGKQRTDSTQIRAAVRTINRRELVIETMRLALNRLAANHPEWLWPRIRPGWHERYALRAENSQLPKEESKRQELASQVGADGFALLAIVFAAATPPEVRGEPAVEVLRQVWIQQYYGPHEPPRWRGEQAIPPPGQLMHAPDAVAARYSSQRGESWVGYKVHDRETCDAERPNLITNVLTTAATLQDDTALPRIHQALVAKGLLPAEHLVDCGDTHAENLLTSQTEPQVRIIGRVADDPSWQARAGEGFAKANFTLDWERQVAICPMGKESYSWLPNSESDAAKGAFQIRFRRKDCTPCASRSPCTKAKVEPRILFVQARAEHEVLQRARAEQETEAFRAEYALRSGVESLMSQGMQAFDLRKARYIGCARTHLQHILIAVAINLVRFIAWVREPEPTPPRVSAFARLAALP